MEEVWKEGKGRRMRRQKDEGGERREGRKQGEETRERRPLVPLPDL